MLGPKIPIPTRLNVLQWEAESSGSLEDKFAVEMVKYGAHLGYEGPLFATTFTGNHPSAKSNRAFLSKYAEKEITAGAVLGPFKSPIFPMGHLNKMGVIPKPKGSGHRVICDMTWGLRSSVNYWTPSHRILQCVYKLRLPSLTLLGHRLLKLGKGAQVWAEDFTDYFRYYGVCPCCIKHTQWAVKQKDEVLYMCDCVLGMGN